MKTRRMNTVSALVVLIASTFMVSNSFAGEITPKAEKKEVTQQDPRMAREPQSEEEATTRWESLRSSLKTLIPVDDNGFFNIKNSYLPKANAIVKLSEEAQANPAKKAQNKKIIQQIVSNSKKSFERAKSSMENYEAILAKPVTVLISYELKIVEDALAQDDFDKVQKKAKQARAVLKFMNKIGN